MAEHLVTILDQMDDAEKADILAKLYRTHVEAKITRETFRRLASSVNTAYIADLRHIIDSPDSILMAFLASLHRTGLSEMTMTYQLNGAPSYQLSILGRIFQQVMRDEPIVG